MTPATGARTSPLLTRPLILVFLTSFGTMISFYLLLSVIPLYAVAIGAGGVAAGFTTGALMLTTIAGELVTPAIIARLGYRRVYGAGLLLLGVPPLILPWTTGFIAVLLACGIRGLGFAIVVTTGGSMAASLLPPERRGEGLGLLGVVVGVPAIVALPLGVWLIRLVGYTPLFLVGGLAALCGVLVLPGLPEGGRQPWHAGQLRVWRGFGSLMRPLVIFGLTAVAAGIIATFLPLALQSRGGTAAALASMALLIQAMAATAARWWAGWHGDRHGSARLLVPAVVLAGIGVLLVGLSPGTAAVLMGMLLFGTGFGIAQNSSLTLLYERVLPSQFDSVSAIWNLAYDSGLGLGAALFGVLANWTGYSVAFALTGVLMLVTVALFSPARHPGASRARPRGEDLPAESDLAQ
jgi:predicted MFS family arabinose efflux permease